VGSRLAAAAAAAAAAPVDHAKSRRRGIMMIFYSPACGRQRININQEK